MKLRISHRRPVTVDVMPEELDDFHTSESSTIVRLFVNESSANMDMSNGLILGKNQSGHLLADGRQRALAANKDRVRMEVLAQFGEELKSAGWFRRLLINRLIRKEIKRRLKRAAPTEAHY